MNNRKAVEDGIVALMDQSAPGANGNGKQPAGRYVEVHMRLNLDTQEFEARVEPKPAVQSRTIMYAMIEMMRDLVYRQALPGELAVLQEVQARAKQIVVAPDGAVPPFPGRG